MKVSPRIIPASSQKLTLVRNCNSRDVTQIMFHTVAMLYLLIFLCVCGFSRAGDTPGHVMFLSSSSLRLVGVYPGKSNVAAVFEFRKKAQICREPESAGSLDCDVEHMEEVLGDRSVDEVIVYYDNDGELIPTMTADGFSIVGTIHSMAFLLTL